MRFGTRCVSQLAVVKHPWKRDRQGLRRADTERDAVDVPVLQAIFPDGQSFLAALRASRGGAGWLALAPPNESGLGERAQVEVSWPALSHSVALRARVTLRDEVGRLWVEIDRRERNKRDYLVATASERGDQLVKSKGHRYAAYLPVQWRVFGAVDKYVGVADEFSTAGMVIRSLPARVTRNDRVIVRLRAFARDELVLNGAVVRVRAPLASRIEISLKFDYRSAEQQRELRHLLRAVMAPNNTTTPPAPK